MFRTWCLKKPSPSTSKRISSRRGGHVESCDTAPVLTHRGAAAAETGKVVLADQMPRRLPHLLDLRNRPGEATEQGCHERRGLAYQGQAVPIDLAGGVVASVKAVAGGPQRFDADLAWNQRIHGQRQMISTDPWGQHRVGHLSERVHTGVGPARPEDGHGCPHDGLQSLFQAPLNAVARTLPLPANEGGSDVRYAHAAGGQFCCNSHGFNLLIGT